MKLSQHGLENFDSRLRLRVAATWKWPRFFGFLFCLSFLSFSVSDQSIVFLFKLGDTSMFFRLVLQDRRRIGIKGSPVVEKVKEGSSDWGQYVDLDSSSLYHIRD